MNFYLNKYGFIPPQIDADPYNGLHLCVVIPCFNEQDLVSTLDSLANCEAPRSDVEVIVVINSGEHHSDEIKRRNQLTNAEFNEWRNDYKGPFHFHLIYVPDLPKKHAGVGLARKIGMDEAVSRFHSIKHDGIIICFDADSTCDDNFLVEIERHFDENPKTPGCSIYFEHPLSGNDFNNLIYEGIMKYELHLRYYNQSLKYSGLPYAFHTVGSSMAVRSSAYQKQGGMNRRKAGEDFYFIHKIIALGNFTELNTTRVIPSPRVSDRVPFGTGKAIGDWVTSDKKEYTTYNFQTFKEIKRFVDFIPQLYQETSIQGLDVCYEFKHFLNENGLGEAIAEAKTNSTSYVSFKKRLLVWFDAFRVLKAVHYLRDTVFPVQNIEQSVSELAEANQWSTLPKSTIVLLTMLREIERNPA